MLEPVVCVCASGLHPSAVTSLRIERKVSTCATQTIERMSGKLKKNRPPQHHKSVLQRNQWTKTADIEFDLLVLVTMKTDRIIVTRNCQCCFLVAFSNKVVRFLHVWAVWFCPRSWRFFSNSGKTDPPSFKPNYDTDEMTKLQLLYFSSMWL